MKTPNPFLIEKRCGEAEAEADKPIVIVCSGSNLRLIGKELLGDEDSLDLDEGGLAALYHDGEIWSGYVVPVSLANAMRRGISDARYS